MGSLNPFVTFFPINEGVSGDNSHTRHGQVANDL